jgi:DNA-binding MarR family transcriptional regulator
MEIENIEKAEKMADLTFELLDQCAFKQEQMAKKLDLTVAEFKLLRSFRNDQILSVSELAKRMDLSNSRLTRILDGLVEKKFVIRELGQKDRRMMEIKLTASGKKIQDEINKIYINTHKDILDLLPQGADDSVIFAMEKLRDAMKKWTVS